MDGDGILRKQPDGHYLGTLAGWEVNVYFTPEYGRWYAWISKKHPRLIVGKVVNGLTVAEAGAAARKWIEEHPTDTMV